MNNEIIIVSWGGIGDALVCTPTYKSLKLKFPDKKIILYYTFKKHRFVFENNPHIDSLRYLHISAMWRYPRHLYYYLFRRNKVKYHTMAFQYIPVSWIYDKNIKEIVPDIFNIELVDKNVQLFFTEKECQAAKEMLAPYKNVIFMHVHSRSSENHHWKMENWVELVRQLPEYTFIQTGSADEPYVEGTVDWRGKTSLRETFCMFRYCTSFVGVESCFAHATNGCGLPGVVLFGDTSPLYWGHDNNINIYKGIPCSPCYYYAWGYACPYGHECMNLITVEEVKQAVIKQAGLRMQTVNSTYA